MGLSIRMGYNFSEHSMSCSRVVGHGQTNGGETSVTVKDELKLGPSGQLPEPSSTAQESQELLVQQVPEPEIEIAINNVVCSFAVRCHLNLRRVATEGANVIYKREHGVSHSPIKL